MKRTPMKRTSMRPPPKPPKVYETYTPKEAPARELRMVDTRARLTVAVPKVKVWQHAGYMDAVRALPCIRCNAPPRSQFCHADEGKGTGTKSDCRAGWPGCAACHHAIGTQRIYPKAERRAFEADYGRRTRAAIIAAGAWPANLPRWAEG